MSIEQNLAETLFKQLAKIHAQQEESNAVRIIALSEWVKQLFVRLSDKENLMLSTLAARISYISHRKQISRAMQWHIFRLLRLSQQLKRYQNAEDAEAASDTDYAASLKTSALVVAAICGVNIPEHIREWLPSDEEDQAQWAEQEEERGEKFSKLRVYIVGESATDSLLTAKRADKPEGLIQIRYGIDGINSDFQQTISAIKQEFGCQCTLNLLDGYINPAGEYIARAFVLEPDYLIDVTGVAECFQSGAVYPLSYVLSKFKGREQTTPLMMGNIANFFLDELLTNPKADFTETFTKSFQQYPLDFANFADDDIRKMHQDSKAHFANLQTLVHQTMKEKDIAVDKCYLEPSFYSETYGVQGRLDVFCLQPAADGKTVATIIELKSGKPYQPNRYNINHNHFIQTVLYELLVRSTFESRVPTAKYVFYSSLALDGLKYAPPQREHEYEAMRVRNQIIRLEKRMMMLDVRPLDHAGLLDQLRPESVPQASGFLRRDMEVFDKVFSGASDLERKYVRAFCAFIAREHQRARTGTETNEANNGAAALWLNQREDKESDFQILSQLSVIENLAASEEQCIRFARPETESAQLANFREGDLVVLYPSTAKGDSALTHQIFKGSLYRLEQHEVAIKLNSRQFNAEQFERADISWCVEHDMMDKTFRDQYAALFKFLSSTSEIRRRLLTLDAPTKTELNEAQANEIQRRLLAQNPKLSPEQVKVLTKAICARDYFLLIGPPGTGKTKFMLAEMVRYLLTHTKENILLLAYTNRAVDEICEAIHDFAETNYLRIGSRSVMEGRFKEQSFFVRTRSARKRKDVIEIVEKHRVFVSTIASITSQSSIFQLKRFDTTLIDEASQVLEPVLVGLLPQFKRFVLIGDDKQLPAVVAQPKDVSRIEDEDLRAIGLHNRRNSLFERLLSRARAQDWHWAFDMLSHQGRMHADICAFPSAHFYEGKLQLLPQEVEGNKWQVAPLKYELPAAASPLLQRLAANRMLFFDTPADLSQNNKVNILEAKLVAEIAASFADLYAANGIDLLPTESIGIITPYRAQIAQIRYALQQQRAGLAELCTIDTVERYQGGAREVIIISICLNTAHQLETLVSLDDTERVDRKLNVALTRARRHLVLVGNEELLRQDSRYAALIDSIK